MPSRPRRILDELLNLPKVTLVRGVGPWTTASPWPGARRELADVRFELSVAWPAVTATSA